MAASRVRGNRFVVIASRFNESITQALVAGALKTLERYGVPRANVRTVWVPGAFELPVAVATVSAAWRPKAIITLGCLIKGQTPQYAAIGHAVAQGVTQVSVSTGIPVALGVVIAGSYAQAKARAGGRVGNRGSEAAEAALEMVDLLRKLPRKSP
jgi:6,7-dimethyl-8-ribityllumazine synthase